MEPLINKYLSFGFVSFIIYFLTAVILLYLIREITLWYFKIDKNTETFERIAESLEKIAISVDYLATDIDQKNINKVNKEVLSTETEGEKRAIIEGEKT